MKLVANWTQVPSLLSAFLSISHPFVSEKTLDLLFEAEASINVPSETLEAAMEELQGHFGEPILSKFRRIFIPIRKHSSIFIIVEEDLSSPKKKGKPAEEDVFETPGKPQKRKKSKKTEDEEEEPRKRKKKETKILELAESNAYPDNK